MNKNSRLTSPIGVAEWPKLQEPDTRFDEVGVYSVDLRVPKAKAKDFIAKVNAIHKEAVAEYTNGKAMPKVAPLPVYVVEDDEGNKTNEVKIRFKVKSKITSRKTGQTWERKPKLFDAKGAVYQGEDIIGSGSKLRVSAEVYAWKSSFGVGVSLQPIAVQILDLVPFTGAGGSADSFGFDVEEGFETESFESFEDDNNTGDEDDF